MEKKQKRLDGVRRQVYDGVSLTARGEQLLEGDAGGSETGQDSLAGPRARAERVVELCQSLTDEMDGQVSHDMLVGSAAADGIAVGKAEHAIEKATEQGDLIGTAEGGYRPGR
jgi:DNA replicative helicase MCM subunit Mcm2 (Cdc46/Mcm family)